MSGSTYTAEQLAEFITQRDALRRVIATGLLRVSFGDRVVYYQTTADMMRAMQDLDNLIGSASVALGLAGATRQVRRVLFAGGGKGL